MPIRREFMTEPTANERPSWYDARQELATQSPCITCVEAIKSMLTPDQWQGLCLGTALKYVWRAQDKGGATDLQKAIDYLNWAKESFENETQETTAGDY